MDKIIEWENDFEAGYMGLSKLPEILREYRTKALAVLENENADHVIYATKIYGDDGETSKVRFYMIPLSDDDFCRRTHMFATMYDGIIYAVHAKK